MKRKYSVFIRYVLKVPKRIINCLFLFYIKNMKKKLTRNRLNLKENFKKLTK